MHKIIEQALQTTRNFLVVGDIMLDQYVIGNVKRISPEAPVPILNVHKDDYKPGGAGNVALNLAGLNSKVTILGYVGKDESSKILLNAFKATPSGDNVSLIPVFWDKNTITKTRVLAGTQQVIRIDRENTLSPSPDSEKALLEQLKALNLKDYDGILISDYNKGVCSHEICRYIIESARESGLTVVIDPKGHTWEKYRGASLVTPNVKELSDVLSKDIPNEGKEIVQEGAVLREKLDIENLLVTRSEKGLTLIGKEIIGHYPAMAREVSDVSGAGDTFISSFLRFQVEGLTLSESINLANFAAGVVCGFVGTHPITKELLLKESRATEQSFVATDWQTARKAGKKIVFTNGCFDILHPGHLDYLQKARDMGDYLIIGLNSDISVRSLKGPTRPINGEDVRKIMLLGLACVDEVILFDEDTPYNLVKSIHPDFLVKGGDYEIENIAGREFSGLTITVPLLQGYSSTDMIEKIRKTHG
jgi:D-beta-D-heptose 7-phosphate kinase/D-beta-D-heptose 1-phosphate adenosyltransferase